jgi:hypothetical protein
MARRAEQAARCPWCDGALRRGATECPECLFPLTMTAVDDGSRATLEPRGTSSTASPAPTPVPRFHAPVHSLPQSQRSHRLRLLAWLLAVTAGLLLVAGIASWITVSSPAARSDAAAQTNLLAALNAARGQGTASAPEIEPFGEDEPSDAPDHVSTSAVDGAWFGAAQSTSGRCYVLAFLLDGTGNPLGGTLGKGEPCSAGEARRSPLGKALADSAPAKKP